MVKVEALINLAKEITIESEEVETGFRVTIKIDNKGYITQLISIEGLKIPLEKEVRVYINILHGELDIEKFMSGTEFEFWSGKKMGYGKVLSIKDVYIEDNSLDGIGVIRQEEILRIVNKINADLKR